jgi:hypothetical protein
MNRIEILYQHYLSEAQTTVESSTAFIREAENEGWVQDLEDVLWGYKSAVDLVPGLSDPVVNDPYGAGLRSRILTEAGDDLTAGVLCALGGLYKAGLNSLRGFLELGLLALYLPLQPNLGKAWFEHKQRTPNFEKILAGLIKHPPMSHFENEYHYESKVGALYYELCAFTHTRGLSRYFVRYGSGFTMRNKSTPLFEPSSLKEWAELCVRAVRAVCIPIVVWFPIGLQSLPLHNKFLPGQEPGELIEPLTGIIGELDHLALLKLFDSEQLDILQKFSDADQTVREIVAWVDSLPDLGT